jgi:TolA-binding protein
MTMFTKQTMVALLAITAWGQDQVEADRVRALDAQLRAAEEASRAGMSLQRSGDQMRMLEQQMQFMKDSLAPIVRQESVQLKLETELAVQAARALAEHKESILFQSREALAAADELRQLAMMQAPAPSPAVAPMPPVPPKAFAFAQSRRGTDEDRLYRSGKSALEEKEWDRASEYFQRLIDRKSARSDAAMYWKAYAQNRGGRRSEAQATLAELVRTHPGSRWLDDAKALEVEVKQSAGQPVSPDAEADEDLKILAVNGMIHSDPDRAIPVLERLLQQGSSPRLKERAVFVLAQSRTPKAREVLLKLARGGVNPDLQYKAVEYFGYQSSPETRQALVDIYSSSTDVHLKRAVIRGFAASRDKERLFSAARSEQTFELRREAIRGLGSASGNDELLQLFQAESTPEMKIEILRALPGRRENLDKLVEAFKAEKDANVQRELLMQIGSVRVPRSGEVLASLYQSSSDLAIRKSIIDALHSQNNAKVLVDIARVETDMKLKRNLIESLSHMKSKEATDFLLELLNK